MLKAQNAEGIQLSLGDDSDSSALSSSPFDNSEEKDKSDSDEVHEDGNLKTKRNIDPLEGVKGKVFESLDSGAFEFTLGMAFYGNT